MRLTGIKAAICASVVALAAASTASAWPGYYYGWGGWYGGYWPAYGWGGYYGYSPWYGNSYYSYYPSYYGYYPYSYLGHPSYYAYTPTYAVPDAVVSAPVSRAIRASTRRTASRAIRRRTRPPWWCERHRPRNPGSTESRRADQGDSHFLELPSFGPAENILV